MVATASTEHSYWLALTQAIAFEWKPGFKVKAIRRGFELHKCLLTLVFSGQRYISLYDVFFIGHPIAVVESPDQGLADSGKDSPIQMEDSGKNSSAQEDSPTPIVEQEGKSAKTVIPITHQSNL